MVVDDGHLSRMVVKQVLGDLGLQHEIFVIKSFHFLYVFVLSVCRIVCKVIEKNPNLRINLRFLKKN